MTAAPGTIRSALGHRDFRRLLIGLAASQAGDWLYNVALLAFVYDRTHSAGWVAVTTAARVVPVVALGPVGGAIADRWDRRRVMVSADAIRAALMLALAAAAATGAPIGLVPVLTAAATAASAPYAACTAATAARLVPDADRPGANAARSAVGMAAIAAGPAVGAILLLLGSPTAAFLLNAVTFVVAGAAVAGIAAGDVFRPGGRGTGRTGLLAGITVGARGLRAHPVAVRVVGADIVCSTVYGLQTVLLLLLAQRLGIGSAGYGWLLAAIGAGGVLGTVLSRRAAESARPRLVLAAALLAVAAAAVAMALPGAAVPVFLAAGLSGAGAVLVEVMTETTLQRDLDDEVFARAYGIAYPASIAGIVLGSLVAAPIVAAVGLTGAFLAIAVLAGGYAAAVARTARPVAVALATS